MKGSPSWGGNSKVIPRKLCQPSLENIPAFHTFRADDRNFHIKLWDRLRAFILTLLALGLGEFQHLQAPERTIPGKKISIPDHGAGSHN